MITGLYSRLLSSVRGFIGGTFSDDEMIWKKRYEILQHRIQTLYEREVSFRPWDDRVSEECISSSNEFFMSNDMDVVDSEEQAEKRWGDRYFKVIREIPFQEKSDASSP